MDINIDLSHTVIQTERLVLRAWKESDTHDLFEYASVDGVGEMMGWKHHETIDESHKMLSDFMANKNELAIVYKQNNKVIGSIGLRSSWASGDDTYKNLSSEEIVYILSKDYWGKGLMPEVVKAVIDFCFNSYGIEVLTCGHFEINPQSKRVIEKCGFSFAHKNQYYSKQFQKNYSNLRYILLR